MPRCVKLALVSQSRLSKVCRGKNETQVHQRHVKKTLGAAKHYLVNDIMSGLRLRY